MATKPTTVPRFAITAGGADAANIAAPTSGEADSGYVVGQTVVSSSKINFLFNWIYKWVLYLKDAVLIADAGSALPGVTATGDGAAPGAQFTPGGAGSPARGALAIPPQTAPTAPSNGDVWTTAAALFARINGATKTQAALETAQTFTQPQTFTGSGANGAVNLVPQTAPSAPSNGDLWTTTAAFFARIAGSTFTLAFLQGVQAFTGTITFTPSASNTNGVTATGNGSGHGVVGTGGAGGNASGVRGTGGSSGGNGVTGTGAGSDAGVQGVGGPTAGSSGVQAVGSAAQTDAWALRASPQSGALRGSFHMDAQSTPINCQPGDMWWDGTNYKVCKVTGTAITLI